MKFSYELHLLFFFLFDCIFKKLLLKQEIEKVGKKILKICKKITNLQNTKIEKQTNLSVFCKLNNELNNIF